LWAQVALPRVQSHWNLCVMLAAPYRPRDASCCAQWQFFMRL
jgi:hypothetical protein